MQTSRDDELGFGVSKGRQPGMDRRDYRPPTEPGQAEGMGRPFNEPGQAEGMGRPPFGGEQDFRRSPPQSTNVPTLGRGSGQPTGPTTWGNTQQGPPSSGFVDRDGMKAYYVEPSGRRDGEHWIPGDSKQYQIDPNDLDRPLSELGPMVAQQSATSFGKGKEREIESGQPQGYQGGQPQGFQSGQPQGFQSGQPQGFQSGQPQGYQTGQTQGYQTGQTPQQRQSGFGTAAATGAATGVATGVATGLAMQGRQTQTGQPQGYQTGQTQGYQTGQTQPQGYQTGQTQPQGYQTGQPQGIQGAQPQGIQGAQTQGFQGAQTQGIQGAQTQGFQPQGAQSIQAMHESPQRVEELPVNPVLISLSAEMAHRLIANYESNITGWFKELIKRDNITHSVIAIVFNGLNEDLYYCPDGSHPYEPNESELQDIRMTEYGLKFKKSDMPLVVIPSGKCCLLSGVKGEAKGDDAVGMVKYSRELPVNPKGELVRMYYHVTATALKRNDFDIHVKKPKEGSQSMDVHYSDLNGKNIDGHLRGQQVGVIYWIGVPKDQIKHRIEDVLNEAQKLPRAVEEGAKTSTPGKDPVVGQKTTTTTKDQPRASSPGKERVGPNPPTTGTTNQ